jgi:hypothetical protein
VVVGALLAAVAITGCDGNSGDDDDDDDDTSSSARCSSICDDIQSAGCGTSDRASCVSGCSNNSRVSNAAGCSDLLDAFLDCAEGIEDKCELVSASIVPCDSETHDLGTCVTPYCIDHPSECE